MSEKEDKQARSMDSENAELPSHSESEEHDSLELVMPVEDTEPKEPSDVVSQPSKKQQPNTQKPVEDEIADTEQLAVQSEEQAVASTSRPIEGDAKPGTSRQPDMQNPQPSVEDAELVNIAQPMLQAAEQEVCRPLEPFQYVAIPGPYEQQGQAANPGNPVNYKTFAEKQHDKIKHLRRVELHQLVPPLNPVRDDESDPYEELAPTEFDSNFNADEEPYVDFQNSEKWKKMGVVDRLYIYPIDGGRGIKKEKLQWFPTGCREVDDSEDPSTFIFQDRCFVVFKHDLITGRREALLDDNNVAAISIARSKDVVTLSSPLTDITAEFKMAEVKKRKPVRINYLTQAHVVFVHECTEAREFLYEVCSLQENIALVLGYYEPKFHYLRNNLNLLRGLTAAQPLTLDFENIYIRTCKARYSSCTLVNEASVQYIDTKCSSYITAEHFHPNIVMNECPQFHEDRVKSLKVGEVHFGIKLFCTHEQCCCVSPIDGTLSDDRDPHITLLLIRPLNHLIPLITTKDIPVFGINMMALNSGNIIKVGDIIQSTSEEGWQTKEGDNANGDANDGSDDNERDSNEDRGSNPNTGSSRSSSDGNPPTSDIDSAIETDHTEPSHSSEEIEEH